VSSHLSFSTDATGRLVIAPVGVRNCVSLRLHTETLDAMSGARAPVELPWGAYGKVRSTMDGPALDGWGITFFAPGRGDAYGVAVCVSGSYDAASSEMISATMTWWRRLNHWNPLGAVTGHLLPMLPTTNAFRSCRRERHTLIALTAVLARRSDLRASLSDPGRMARLACDLSNELLSFPVERTGVSRDAVDIIIAMHGAGYVHTFGRPFAGDALPALPDIVARVRARLDANPFRKGRVIDDETIARIARRTYLDVKPWPFAALLPCPPAPP
jgi:hypothetical protein